VNYRSLICLAVFALSPALVRGQSQANTGSIEGIVNDPSSRASLNIADSKHLHSSALIVTDA